MEIIASCPHATQPMVNALLQTMKGYQYQAYEAGAANIDPAAELGDGVTVGGIYSPLSKLSDDGRGYAGISSPGEAEMEDEYPSDGYITQEFNRKIAETRSTITKTSEEIMLKVEGLDGKYTEVKTTLDGVTISDASGTTRIKGSSIDTTTLAAKSITVDKLNLTGQISFGDLDSATQDAISKAQDAGDVISAWEYPGSTYIDGSKIMAGTVMASQLLGGTVGLLASNQDVVGALTIAYTTTGIGLGIATSYGGIQIQSAGNVYISSAHNTRLQLDKDAAKLGPTVWATDGTVIYSSDRNVKHDIEYDLSRYRQFLLDLKPCRFKYDNGQSGRFHVGLIAQDMERSLVDNGLTAMDFSGWCQMPIRDEEGGITGYTYGIRYDSLIPLNTMMIQELERRVTALERRE
nr:MAG TPA: endosialidase chaperone [Bacteriophage sp.]